MTTATLGHEAVTIESRQTYLTWKLDGKTMFADLFHATDWDKENLPEKKNCTLFRYSNECTKIGGMMPAIMINIDRKLIYFFDQETERWETRGLKAQVWPEKWDVE